MTETVSPHHVANRAPLWLIVIFALGVIPPLVLAAAMLASLTGAGNGGGLNFLIDLMLAGGSVAALSVQVSGLAGLLARRHWAREVALLAELFWALAGAGFIVASIGGGAGQVGLLVVAAISLVMGFFATRTLWGGWDLGPAPVYEDAIQPHGFVTWASACAALLFVPFLGFAVWLVFYLHSLLPSEPFSDWIMISILLTLITLPWFLVHAFAAYGLDHRHDYGLVVAIIGGVLWFFTLVGIPIGLAQLGSVWKVSHPVLALTSRLASRGAAQA